MHRPEWLSPEAADRLDRLYETGELLAYSGRGGARTARSVLEAQFFAFIWRDVTYALREADEATAGAPITRTEGR